MSTENLSKTLRELKKLSGDLNDDFKWLEAVRKIRGLGDNLRLTSATKSVGELLVLCDQITREYPTADVTHLYGKIVESCQSQIQFLVKMRKYNFEDRKDAEQTAKMILIERLEQRGLGRITRRYIDLIVQEALYGGTRNAYNQILATVRLEAYEQIDQHRAEYERICKEIGEEPTSAGFDKYIEQWCKDRANEILNAPYPIDGGEDEDESRVDRPATEKPIHLYEHELEELHSEIRRALTEVKEVPTARLIHLFFQSNVFGKDQKRLAKEIGRSESTISRDLWCRIPTAIKTIVGDDDFEQMASYFGWLRDWLPETITFTRPNDLKFLITRESWKETKEAGEVMWEAYDWFRKNWRLMQFNRCLRISISECWFMNVNIDYYDESAEISRLTLQKKFRQ